MERNRKPIENENGATQEGNPVFILFHSFVYQFGSNPQFVGNCVERHSFPHYPVIGFSIQNYHVEIGHCVFDVLSKFADCHFLPPLYHFSLCFLAVVATLALLERRLAAALLEVDVELEVLGGHFDCVRIFLHFPNLSFYWNYSTFILKSQEGISKNRPGPRPCIIAGRAGF